MRYGAFGNFTIPGVSPEVLEALNAGTMPIPGYVRENDCGVRVEAARYDQTMKSYWYIGGAALGGLVLGYLFAR